jgi:hypothetical protein
MPFSPRQHDKFLFSASKRKYFLALIPLWRRHYSGLPPAATRTFFFPGSKSQILFNPLSGVLNTHRTLLPGNLPFALSGDRVSFYRETCGHDSRATQNPEPRWVSMQMLSILVGDFPIGKSAYAMLQFTSTTNFRTPNSNTHVRSLLATSPPLSVLLGIV